MSSNWVTALDNLAASGVIDFDAPAYLLGQKPRYIGNPSLGELPLTSPMYLPEGVKMKDIPQSDLYEQSKSHDLVHNPSWKKWLFAGVAALGAVLIGGAIIAGKGKVSAGIKNIKNSLSNIKMPKLKTPKFLKGIGTKVSSFLKTVWTYIKKPFQYIASKIRK